MNGITGDVIAQMAVQSKARNGKRSTTEPTALSVAQIQAMSEASQTALAMRLGGVVK